MENTAKKLRSSEKVVCSVFSVQSVISVVNAKTGTTEYTEIHGTRKRFKSDLRNKQKPGLCEAGVVNGRPASLTPHDPQFTIHNSHFTIYAPQFSARESGRQHKAPCVSAGKRRQTLKKPVKRATDRIDEMAFITRRLSLSTIAQFSLPPCPLLTHGSLCRHHLRRLRNRITISQDTPPVWWDQISIKPDCRSPLRPGLSLAIILSRPELDCYGVG